jgi:hypothetical protein
MPNWLKPFADSSSRSLEIRDRTGAPVKGTVETFVSERIVPTAHGTMHEYVWWERVRLWRGQTPPDRRDV